MSLMGFVHAKMKTVYSLTKPFVQTIILILILILIKGNVVSTLTHMDITSTP